MKGGEGHKISIRICAVGGLSSSEQAYTTPCLALVAFDKRRASCFRFSWVLASAAMTKLWRDCNQMAVDGRGMLGNLAVAAWRKAEPQMLPYSGFCKGSCSKYTLLILDRASCITGVRNLWYCRIVHNIARGNGPTSRRRCAWLAGSRGNRSLTAKGERCSETSTSLELDGRHSSERELCKRSAVGICGLMWTQCSTTLRPQLVDLPSRLWLGLCESKFEPSFHPHAHILFWRHCACKSVHRFARLNQIN